MAETQTHTLGGTDPGVRSGGLVFIDTADRDRVLAAYSLVEKSGAAAAAKAKAREICQMIETASDKGWGDAEYISLVLRANDWARRYFEAFDGFVSEHGDVDAMAIESFVDQASKAKEIHQKRFQTPHLIGVLVAGFAERGYTVENGKLVFQNAGVVIRQLANEIHRLEERDALKIDADVLHPGDRLLTNDHLRKAWAHALALSLRLNGLH